MDADLGTTTALQTKPNEMFSPLLATILFSVHAAAFFGIFYFFSWHHFWLLVGVHTYFAMFGIALGHHRYFSHASFKSTRPLHYLLGLTSTLCFQGGPIFWAAVHRCHHQMTEKRGDPHSATRGFWWSHMGWMFYLRPNGFSFARATRLVPDLMSDPYLLFLERHAVNLNFAVLGAGAVAFYLAGRLDLYFWFFPIRIASVWHATWLINSWYHGAHWFSQQLPTGLRNNIVADLILGGEGSHRNHHNRPALLKNSKHWYQLDFGYWMVLLLKRLGLVISYRGQIQRDHDFQASQDAQTNAASGL